MCVCVYICTHECLLLSFMKALNKKRHILLEHPIFNAPRNISRQVVVSHKAKKKQHVWASSGLCDHYSELFTWMAALKL